MERTVYQDGVLVDQSDLRNTEDTKSAEIRLTRTSISHFGVIEGLSTSVTGATISVSAGKGMCASGEIVTLTAPLTNISGASMADGVSTFLGLRVSDVTSNPKPHENGTQVFDTRANNGVSAELFVAASASVTDRDTALANAMRAVREDQNFILLDEFLGVHGQGLSAGRIGQIVPVADGGTLPAGGASAKQLYNADALDIFAFATADDRLHRSYIGSGIPNAKNPHGTSLHDIGGDSFVDSALQRHQLGEHANGIIGLEPTSNPPEGDFTATNGTFGFVLSGTSAVLNGILTGESVQVNGHAISAGTLISAAGATATATGISLNFASPKRDPGLYYLFYYHEETPDVNGNQDFIDAYPYDASNNGLPAATSGLVVPKVDNVDTWLNNAIRNGERKFLVIGLVNWGGTGFSPIGQQVTVPGWGTLTLSDVPHPRHIPTTATLVDLRRWGTVNAQAVQKRTLDPSHFAAEVVPETVFITHAGKDSVGNDVGGVESRADPNRVGPNAKVTRRHLTDDDAATLFGHRKGTAAPQHEPARGSDARTLPDDSAKDYGFQTNQDKWRQDNLTMTIFKWADLQAINTTSENAIGDAAAVSSVKNPDSTVGGGYVVFRKGVLKNYGVTVSDGLGPASVQSLNVFARARPVSLEGSGTSAGVTSKQIASILGKNVTGIAGYVSCNTSAESAIEIDASLDNPWVIQISRRATGGTGWRDLTVTAEFHYSE